MNEIDKNEMLKDLDPDRREFISKCLKGAFVIPAVASVSMLNSRLSMSTAMAQSNGPSGCECNEVTDVSQVCGPGDEYGEVCANPRDEVYGYSVRCSEIESAIGGSENNICAPGGEGSNHDRDWINWP